MIAARAQRAAIMAIHAHIPPWQLDLLTLDEESAIFDQLTAERN